MLEANAKRECPFPGCDWSDAYDAEDYADQIASEEAAELHYERKHGGKVRIQLTFELENCLGDRDPKEIRERYLDEFEDEYHFGGFQLAHVATEITEEPDDHAVLNGDDL